MPTSNDKDRFDAAITIQNTVSRQEDDLFVKSVQCMVRMISHCNEPVEDCPTRNIIGLAGLVQSSLRCKTAASSVTERNRMVNKFSVSPVVQLSSRSKD